MQAGTLLCVLDGCDNLDAAGPPPRSLGNGVVARKPAGMMACRVLQFYGIVSNVGFCFARLLLRPRGKARSPSCMRLAAPART